MTSTAIDNSAVNYWSLIGYKAIYEIYILTFHRSLSHARRAMLGYLNGDMLMTEPPSSLLTTGPYLLIREAAELYGFPENTFHTFARRGSLPTHRFLYGAVPDALWDRLNIHAQANVQRRGFLLVTTPAAVEWYLENRRQGYRTDKDH